MSSSGAASLLVTLEPITRATPQTFPLHPVYLLSTTAQILGVPKIDRFNGSVLWAGSHSKGEHIMPLSLLTKYALVWSRLSLGEPMSRKNGKSISLLFEPCNSFKNARQIQKGRQTAQETLFFSVIIATKKGTKFFWFFFHTKKNQQMFDWKIKLLCQYILSLLLFTFFMLLNNYKFLILMAYCRKILKNAIFCGIINFGMLYSLLQ